MVWKEENATDVTTHLTPSSEKLDRREGSITTSPRSPLGARRMGNMGSTWRTETNWLEQFFKGRISRFGNIKMSVYNADKSIDPLPSHYSSEWWTAGLIKEVIYMSLNLWQHRNRFLHNTESTRAEIIDRTKALEEAAEWYNKKRQFPREDQVHFHRSYTERCSDTTKQVHLWLQKIADLYECNQRRTLQSFFTA